MDNQDEITAHDLYLLSIGYYIHGGITSFYAVIMCLYIGALGTIFSKFGGSEQLGRENLPPNFIGILTAIFGFFLLLLVAYSASVFLAGYWVRRHRHMLFIQIVAALTCLLIPYGTVLGIFTFLTVGRPAAKRLFDRRVAQI